MSTTETLTLAEPGDGHEHVWELCIIVASMDPESVGLREYVCDLCDKVRADDDAE